MARTFASASSQYLLGGSAPTTGYPISIACWFNLSALPALSCELVTVGNSGTVDFFALRVFLTGALLMTSNDAMSQSDASAGSVSTDTWYHGAGVVTGNTNRDVYFNGSGTTANDTGSTAVGTVNRISIGSRYSNGSAARYVDGRIAEVGVWNVALTTADVDALARGASPLRVRPSGLVFYAPLIRGVSASGGDDIDVRGGIGLVDNGTVTVGDHPRVYRAGSGISRSTPAAGGGTTYNESVSESVTAAESSSSALTTAGTTTESVTGAESSSSVLTTSGSTTEDVTGAESSTGLLVMAASLTESGTGGESCDSSMTAIGSCAESVTGAESSSALMVMASSVTESVTAAESSFGFLQATAAYAFTAPPRPRAYAAVGRTTLYVSPVKKRHYIAE